jgi:N-acylneuraminate cytidylyltransferase
LKLAIIPARGGSKRIPRKNIKFFMGLPMIAWSIKKALNSKIFDRVIVSTDDEEIACIAREYGAEVPFIRPSELADDFAGTVDVIRHAVGALNLDDCAENYVCCIYATAPFLVEEDLVSGYKKIENSEWDFVFSATKYVYPIQRAFKKNINNSVEMLFPENFSVRSQDLPEVFHDAAQFYWGTSYSWLNSKSLFGKKSTIVDLPAWRVQDIDHEDDWIKAELLYQSINNLGIVK